MRFREKIQTLPWSAKLNRREPFMLSTTKQPLNNRLLLVTNFLVILLAFTLPLSISLTDVLFILVIAVNFIAGEWHKKLNLIFHNPTAVFCLIFFALFVVSLFYTTAPIHEALIGIRKYDKLLFLALLIPAFTDEKCRVQAINAFIVAATLMLFLSYLKVMGIIHWYDQQYGHLAVFISHIDFNFIMAFAAYLIMLKILTAARHHRYLLAILLIFYIYHILFLDDGRTGYFIFGGLVLLLCIQKIGSWKGILIACVSIALLVGSAFVFSNTFKGRVQEIFSDIKVYQQNQDTSVGLRLTFYKNCLYLIKEHPILGTGVGSFKTEYSNIKPTPSTVPGTPHNEYLFVGVQLGIVGILMLIGLFGLQLWYSRLLPKNERFITQAVVVSIALGCLANSFLALSILGHFYAYFTALTFAAYKEGGKSRNEPQLWNRI